jgi:hypothetical protein
MDGACYVNKIGGDKQMAGKKADKEKKGSGCGCGAK